MLNQTRRHWKKDDNITMEEKFKQESVHGQLLCMTSQKKPDVAFDTFRDNNYGINIWIKDITEAHKAIKKFHSNKFRLVFS